MILNGKLANVRQQNTKSGMATVVELTCQGAWDKDKRQFGPDVTKAVWYYNTAKAKSADWAFARQTDIGKDVILTAHESIKDGKTFYFGRYLPTSYGMVHNPAEMKDPTEEERMEAINAIEDCRDAGEIPDDVEVDFTDPASIASVISILVASGSTIAKDATACLRKLIYGESNAYIGKIGFAGRSGKIFRVTFVTPKSSPAEWNSVSFFNEMADRAEKVLKKGDNAILFLGEKSEYNGSPAYVGRNFHKLG